MTRVVLRYDYENDNMHIGLDCFAGACARVRRAAARSIAHAPLCAVCGDADGDGDAGSSSPQLVARGGDDLADFGGSESVVIALDVDLDNNFDFVIGYPGEAPVSCGCLWRLCA